MTESSQTEHRPMRVLFLCTHNSSRSQMAEGLLRSRGGDAYEVFSAGTMPRSVHPLAIRAMSEIGIDLTTHRAEGIEEFAAQPPMDLVITVCDEAAKACPSFPNARQQVHWGFVDPSAVTGSEEKRLTAFRHVRDLIAAKINQFLGRSPAQSLEQLHAAGRGGAIIMSHLVIVGGSDAGISAALRAKELESTTQVTVLVEDAFPNYSICGLPFYLSGEVKDFHQLAHRTHEMLTQTGIQLLLNQKGVHIDPVEHRLTFEDQSSSTSTLSYDQLIIATGARPRHPTISGSDLPGVFFLHTMDESFQMQEYLSTHPVRTALIVGGGYIGLEMADALTQRGLVVTLVEHGQSVLKTVDPDLGTLVQGELERHGVTVSTGIAVKSIEVDEAGLCVNGTNGFLAHADLVLLAVGVEPRTELAQTAGVELGKQGAIRVTRKMETSIPDILAAGDCVETWHRILRQPTYLPLGTTAHKQGRIAGETALGRSASFAGTLGTQVVKVFDLVIARTGLRDHEARAAHFDPLTHAETYWDHKVYYPGAQPVRLCLTGDRTTGRFLGAQLAGSVQTEVAKRIDILATALFREMTIEGLSDLDLSYTPPLGSPWDLVQMGAQAWVYIRTSH